ncbi:MAG: TIGR03915 family putative DNA repair protein [Lachnospiraceae bacterium]|nr:TIGR03915 family putative DNA repair protein [Lachnospiraceae bacterium]
MEEKVLICEDSVEGVFTAIYEIYEQHMDLDTTRVQTSEDENIRLFATYQSVTTDLEKANKVTGTIRKRLGEDAYKDICMALTTTDADKAQAVFRTVVTGLRMTRGNKIAYVMDNLSDDSVRKVMTLSRNAGNELHHMIEFVRFEEMTQGFLMARFSARNKILPVMIPHFADRLPSENFIIYDERHDWAAVHPARRDWILVEGAGEKLHLLEDKLSPKEMNYQDLYRHFVDKIAIDERRNYELQRNMLPIRFRKYMTEFQ